MFNIIMFEKSKITLKEVLDMIECIYVNFNLSKAVGDAIIDLTKVLAGPEFTSININSYFMSKLYKPFKDVKTFTFYCSTCNTAFLEPISKSQLKKKTNIKCKNCEKLFILSTIKDNYFVNIDIEYQIMNILSNQNILQITIENALKLQNKRSIHNDSICDIHDGDVYKTNSFFNHKNKEDVVLTLNVNSDGASMFQTTKKLVANYLNIPSYVLIIIH